MPELADPEPLKSSVRSYDPLGPFWNPFRVLYDPKRIIQSCGFDRTIMRIPSSQSRPKTFHLK